jgi:hypothetical protein
MKHTHCSHVLIPTAILKVVEDVQTWSDNRVGCRDILQEKTILRVKIKLRAKIIRVRLT